MLANDIITKFLYELKYSTFLNEFTKMNIASVKEANFLMRSPCPENAMSHLFCVCNVKCALWVAHPHDRRNLLI